MSTRLILLGGVLAMAAFACSRRPGPSPEPPPFEILPDLRSEANAAFVGPDIPWHATEPSHEARISARMNHARTLVRISQGDWTRTLYRFEYRIDTVLEGRMEDPTLTFFAQRPSPTPESGILLKELWPFAPDTPLIFKLRRASDRWVIVSVEG